MVRFLRKASPKSLHGTALLRLDFNTKDDWRMRAVLPSIKFLLKHSAKTVIVSHRGRPEGVRVKNGVPVGFKADMSLRKDAVELSHLIKRKVIFVSHFRFAEIKTMIAAAPHGSVFLLENLRFLKGEEENSAALARSLASLADFYVNDAFAVSHRANASVAAITKFLPHFAGFELEREISSLSKAMHPKRPLVLILGGAKAADKLGVIKFFKKKTDWFLLGGGPANSILRLEGMDTKKSVRDRDPKDLKELKELSRYKSVILPVDFKWENDAILDFGPKTIQLFAKKIRGARTILWSGPLGQIEKKKFAHASIAVARAIAKNKKAFSVSGGGETVMFLKQYKLDKKFSFISTGGGAMVDFLAGKKLPGIQALE